MSIVFNHGFACFDKMVAGSRKKLLSGVEERFYSSILRFEIRTSEVKREVGMTLIDQIEWGHTSSRMSKVVVCNFSSSKIFRPRGRVVSSVDTKILFESAIGAFSLTVSLRMVSSREAKSSFSQREEFTPKWDRNRGSRSETMLRGNPCRRTILSRNSCARSGAVICV